MKTLLAALGLSLLAGDVRAIGRDDTTQVPYPLPGQAAGECRLPPALSGLHAVLAQPEGKKKPLTCREILEILAANSDPRKVTLLATRAFIERIREAGGQNGLKGGKEVAKGWPLKNMPDDWSPRYLTKEELTVWQEVFSVLATQKLNRAALV